MPGVELGPGSKLALVDGFGPLFLVPPGTAAIQVGSNIRGADNGHGESIAQIFYFFLPPFHPHPWHSQSLGFQPFVHGFHGVDGFFRAFREVRVLKDGLSSDNEKAILPHPSLAKHTRRTPPRCGKEQLQ